MTPVAPDPSLSRWTCQTFWPALGRLSASHLADSQQLCRAGEKLATEDRQSWAALIEELEREAARLRGRGFDKEDVFSRLVNALNERWFRERGLLLVPTPAQRSLPDGRAEDGYQWNIAWIEDTATLRFEDVAVPATSPACSIPCRTAARKRRRTTTARPAGS